jgi:ubiquitin C-terminal hydrolase
VADEYWRGYLSRNDSIIVQLFTGQFKSKTKCPQCQKVSLLNKKDNNFISRYSFVGISYF